MKYVFIVASILQLIYVSRRKMDFFSVGAVCHIIYNIYCANGVVFVSSHEHAGAYYYYSQLFPQVYGIVLSQMLILFFAMYFYDKKSHSISSPFIADKYSNKTRMRCNVVSLCIVLGIMLYNVARIGISGLLGSKSAVWGMVSGLYITANWMGMAIFTYGLKEKKVVLSILGLVPVLLHLFIGSRAYFAASCIVALLIFGENIGKTIKKRWKVILLAFVTLVFILAYKQVYYTIKSGGSIVEILRVFLNVETYAFVFRLGEPRIVLSNLNYIIDQNITLGINDWIDRIVSMIPFLDNLLGTDQYTPVSSIISSGLQSSYGLASNIWGEFFAMGSYPFMFLMFLLWIRILAWGNTMIKRDDWSSNFALPIIAYFSFYIHRLDFVKAIGNVKMVLMGILVYIIIGFIFSRNMKLYINKKRTKNKRMGWR